MDSYIGDELLVETNHEMLLHLENCPSCRTELADRRDLRLRLRHSVRNSIEYSIDPVFTTRLRSNLRDQGLRPRWLDAIQNHGRALTAGFAVAAIALFFFGLGSLGWLDRPQTTAGLQDVPPTNVGGVATPDFEIVQAVKASWRELTGHAIGDHKNCAVEYNLGEEPITLDEAAQIYGPFDKGLDKTVVAAVKAEFTGTAKTKFIESHSCVFEGRRFAHIVLEQNGKMVSVLVTDTDLPMNDGEIATSTADGKTNAAGLHVGHRAVFVVSDLSNTENVTIARVVAPAIRLHAEKVGA